MACDQALIRLSYTREQLKRAVKEVRDAIPDDVIQAADALQSGVDPDPLVREGGPGGGQGLGRGVEVRDAVPLDVIQAADAVQSESDLDSLVREGGGQGQRGGQAFGNLQPPRRFLSTVCEFCGYKEREMGTAENDPKLVLVPMV